MGCCGLGGINWIWKWGGGGQIGRAFGAIPPLSLITLLIRDKLALVLGSTLIKLKVIPNSGGLLPPALQHYVP